MSQDPQQHEATDLPETSAATELEYKGTERDLPEIDRTDYKGTTRVHTGVDETGYRGTTRAEVHTD